MHVNKNKEKRMLNWDDYKEPEETKKSQPVFKEEPSFRAN